MRKDYCVDCGVDTDEIGELFYFLTDDLWEKIWPGTSCYDNEDRSQQGEGKHILCIGCVEKRLGRELKKKDFEEGYGFYSENSSERLKKRAEFTVVGDLFYEGILTAEDVARINKEREEEWGSLPIAGWV